MRPRPDRWESGSEFPQPAADELDGAPAYPWGAGGALFGSGRQALYAALAAGRGWRRLWAPSYFCPSVVAALAPVGLPVRRYADAPDRPRRLDDVPFETGDVLLLVNTLGDRKSVV